MEKRLMSITIAVKDLDAAIAKYESVLGVKPQHIKPEDYAFPGMKGASFRVGDAMLTLMASDQPDTSIYKFVENKGEGIFLISIEVPDVAQTAKELLQKGIRLVSEKPMAFSGGTVIFVHPKSMHGVQVEFTQLVKGSMFASKLAK